MFAKSNPGSKMSFLIVELDLRGAIFGADDFGIFLDFSKSNKNLRDMIRMCVGPNIFEPLEGLK